MATLDERLNDAVVGLANVLLCHVLPLFTQTKGKRPVVVGTGFLVQHNGSSFLVSAAHVLDHVQLPRALYYYVEPGTLCRVVGTVLRTTPPNGNRSEDRFDVGVVRLVDTALPPYPLVSKHSIGSASLRASQLPRTSKQYVVVGFPKSQSHANPANKQLKSRPYAFRIASAEAKQYQYLGLSDESHIVMQLDASHMFFPDGQVRAMPDPHGMSGSPLWLLYDAKGPNDPTSTPIVGVVIEYHKTEKLIVATDIALALHLINEATT